VETKELVRALRKQLDLTQEEVAERSGGMLKRHEISKIESGTNQARSDRVRGGLARAFGLSRDHLASYLEGKIDLEAVLSLSGHSSGEILLDSRYQNAQAAALFAHYEKIPESIIEEVQSDDLFARNDPPPQAWLEEMRSRWRAARFAAKDPEQSQERTIVQEGHLYRTLEDSIPERMFLEKESTSP
jgi:transcriptional regulator with XRE-family HTH domain